MREGHLWPWLERRRGNTYRKHDAIALGWIVGHRVSTDGRHVVLAFQSEESELLPCRQVLVADKALVDVLVIVHLVCRNLDLRIASRHEIHVLTRGQLYDKLFDKRCNVLVGDDLALPLFHAEDTLRDLDFEVALHLALASQTPMVLNLLAGEVRTLGIENLATAFYNLTLALTARALAATGRRQVDTVLGKRAEQTIALTYGQGFVIINRDCYISARRQIFLGNEQDDNQKENRNEKNSYT